MSELEFARLLQVHRNRLGLSQARVAELIGRAPATVRSWEKGGVVPADPTVIKALAAVLGIKEAQLFAAAEVAMPEESRQPTIEQALSEIAPDDEGLTIPDPIPKEESKAPMGEDSPPPIRRNEDPAFRQRQLDAIEGLPGVKDAVEARFASQTGSQPQPKPTISTPALPITDRIRDWVSGLVGTLRGGTGPRPMITVDREPTYMEITEERLAYKARVIYTAVGMVILLIVFLWAAGKTLDAIGASLDIVLGRL